MDDDLEVGLAELDSVAVGPGAADVLALSFTGSAERPGTARMLIEPSDELGAIYAAGGSPTILFMNRKGGTYTPGGNDSRINRSSIPNATVTFAAWDVSDAGWAQVMAHMQDIWAPYNVTVTDVDPGDVPHYESTMFGDPRQVGLPAGVLGVSPYTTDCSVIQNSIAWTFADYAVRVLGPNYREIAEIASQEVAHSFGLDHELEASDPMTYLSYNGNRRFSDQAVNCGEDSPRNCGLPQVSQPCSDLGVPGSTTKQNSHRLLLERIGALELAPPVVAIQQPSDGATVSPGFVVGSTVATSGGLAVSRVELVLNGAVVRTATESPYTFNAPADLEAGAYTVTVRATDANGQSAESSIGVTVQAAGGDPDPGDPGGNPDPGDSNPGDDPPPEPADPGQPAEIIGACQLSSGASSTSSLALVGLGLALARRRRRRR
jgi:hypothetical protein